MENEKIETVISDSENSLWQTFLEGLNGFTSDIFEDGRDQGVQPEREAWPEGETQAE